MMAPILPGMITAHHEMVAGTTEKDYYQGKVTGATAEQIAVARESDEGSHA